jgi:hypothetical protein
MAELGGSASLAVALQPSVVFGAMLFGVALAIFGVMSSSPLPVAFQ